MTPKIPISPTLFFLISTLWPSLNPAFSGLLDYEKNNVEVYRRVVPSVVNVSTFKKGRTWEYGTVEVPRGAGSGIVWDKDGHIITNYHVIAGVMGRRGSPGKAKSAKLTVSFFMDKVQYEATYVGGEPNKDIAVIKLKKRPSKLGPIELGTSKGLRVGQGAIAIGNPFGLDHTMTAGIISATGRQIESVGGATIRGVIQTDADINPGNSGGPLVDTSGKLIGMNTMIVSRSGSSAGLGFAVPVDTIKRIVKEIIQYGEVKRPGLGITLVTDEIIKRRFEISKGVIVGSVQQGGPAQKAGIEGMKQDRWGRIYLGDVLIKIGDTEVNNFDDIYHTLEKYKVGQKVTITYVREGKKKSASLRLKKISY
ncbi:MAG: trypsin-like peptidase domain-containing protein [Bacteriovoracales bacterium]|nr:trypsin-like peptidase domain-containing protein [Bacteriovoracales bacterium]